MENRRQ